MHRIVTCILRKRKKVFPIVLFEIDECPKHFVDRPVDPLGLSIRLWVVRGGHRHGGESLPELGSELGVPVGNDALAHAMVFEHSVHVQVSHVTCSVGLACRTCVTPQSVRVWSPCQQTP